MMSSGDFYLQDVDFRKELNVLFGNLTNQIQKCTKINAFKMDMTATKEENQLAVEEYLIRTQSSYNALQKTTLKIQKLTTDYKSIINSYINYISSTERYTMIRFLEENNFLDKMNNAEILLEELFVLIQLAQLINDKINKNLTTDLTTTKIFKKLPNVNQLTLEIQRFNGNPEEGLSFYKILKSTIDKNNNLEKIDKLKYLINLLEEDVKKMVKGYSITNEYYLITKK